VRLCDLVERHASAKARRAVADAVQQAVAIEFEAPLATSQGSGRPLLWQITPVTDADGHCRQVVALGLDLTALAPWDHGFIEAFFAHTLAATALADRELKLIRVNEAYSRIFGREPDELAGRNLAEFYAGDVDAALRSVSTEKEPHVETETPFVLPDRPEGGVTYWDCEVVPVLDDLNEVAVVLVSVRNVTERKRATDGLERSRARLRALAAQLTMAETRERRRIARELHDGLGHALSYAMTKLGELRDHVPGDAISTADELETFVGRAIDAANSMTFELSPPILFDLGLGPALEWHADRIEREHGLRVDVDMPEQNDPFPEDIAVMLFQTARELLANVLKHAQATRASVSVVRTQDAAHLAVQDDGVGFAPSELDDSEKSTSTFGLLSITERTAHMGGRTDIMSGHGQGTCVTCVVPLATVQNEEEPL
jgi:PAS domain S-box-containing protein